MLPRQHFVRIIGALAAAGVMAAGVYHYSPPPSGGSPNFSGDFACYGNGSSCWTAEPCTGAPISSGLSAAISSAAAGDVICLNAGTYSLTSNVISGVTKSSDVTIQPATTSTAVTINNFAMDTDSHLKFVGETIDGVDLGQYSGSPGGPSAGTFITFSHIKWSGPVNITHHGGDPAAHLTIDGSTFDDLGPGIHDGRLQFEGDDPSSTEGSQQDLTIVISNNRFSNQLSSAPGNGNCSDGINSSTNAAGVTIGPGNEFTGLSEGSCGTAHVDPIQTFASAGAWDIVGNWFHDNGDNAAQIGNYDGDAPGTVVENNVFDCGSSDPCGASARPWEDSGDNWQFKHNTLVGSYDARIDLNNGQTPSGSLLQDNVFEDGAGIALGAGYGTANHNLNCGCSGTGNITGTGVFVSSPASGYYHWQLDASSPGYNAASDGASMGIGP